LYFTVNVFAFILVLYALLSVRLCQFVDSTICFADGAVNFAVGTVYFTVITVRFVDGTLLFSDITAGCSASILVPTLFDVLSRL
jgi:hypothetical protein